jgi:hypothetical protein
LHLLLVLQELLRSEPIPVSSAAGSTAVSRKERDLGGGLSLLHYLSFRYMNTALRCFFHVVR